MNEQNRIYLREKTEDAEEISLYQHRHHHGGRAHHHFAIILFTDAAVRMVLTQRLTAACRPAKYPVAQAHWKLNPPIRPSQSRISPTR